jgi:protein-disulfide isomerase
MTRPNPSRRALLLSAIAVVGTGTAWWLFGRSSPAPVLALQATAEEGAVSPVAEMFLGNPDAKVTLVEYGSFTCPHCAAFYAEVYPRLKAEYIDTGKVKFVFRDFYRNRQDLWAGMLARCAGGMRYFGLVDLFFSQQENWAFDKTEQQSLEAMYALGRQSGLTDDQMQACLADQANAQALVAEFQRTSTEDKVEGTPTFTINGTKVPNSSWEEFKTALDAALGS